MRTLEIYFLLFISYSVLGWLMEVICKLIESKKFVNRGFLIGPYCPIYGCGALLITFLLQHYVGDALALFMFAVVICSILEYLTSYVMEKIFKARWWDYSERKFNINGRICLKTMLPFGILGVIIMYFINPFFINIYSKLSDLTLSIVTMTLLVIYLTDIIISTVILTGIRKDNKVLDKDNTEEMNKKVKEVIINHGWPYRRLLQAFPNVKHIGRFVKQQIGSTKANIDKILAKQETLKQKTEVQILNIKVEQNKKIKVLKAKSTKKIDHYNKKYKK